MNCHQLFSCFESMKPKKKFMIGVLAVVLALIPRKLK